jgi:glycosyltransferase involved in cell wall biosynthesis
LSRAVRVLAVTNMYPTPDDPAYGVFVASQISSLTRLGVAVHVEFIDGRRSRLRYLVGIRRVRALASTGDFDVVHAHFGLTGFVCSFQPLPLVISYCGDDLLGASNGRGGSTIGSLPMVWLSRIAASRADQIICKSERLANALPRHVNRSRVSVIGNGVDTDIFSPGERNEARARLGIARDARLILFPHDVRQRVKRYDLAQAAVRTLRGRGVDGTLWVVNGVPHQQLPDYYRAADCLLLTSDHEGSPNTIKEGLCCDLPVVAVDAGDTARWIALASGSRIVDRTPDAIAEGLQAVLATGLRIDGSRIRAELGLSSVADRVLAVYEAALTSAPRSTDRSALGIRAA